VTLGAGATVAALTTNSDDPERPQGLGLRRFGLAAEPDRLPGVETRALLSGRPQAGVACQTSRVWNRRILVASISLWLIGFFFAFLLFPLVLWRDQ